MNLSIEDTTHAMQTAVAPVFLILGASGLLASMSVRFGRIIDRARFLMAGPNPDGAELGVLRRRARLLRGSMLLNAASILLTIATIFVIFATVLFDLDVPFFVPTLFGASLLTLMVSVGRFIEDFAISLRVFEGQLASAKHRLDGAGSAR